MATNHETITVGPELPTRLITGLAELLLRESGFSFAASEGGTTYLFADDGGLREVDPNDLVHIESDELAAVIAAGTDPLLERLAPCLDGTGGEERVWDIVLQALLQQTPRDEGLDEIVVQGGYWCSKARHGEFGGWIARITRDAIQFGDLDTVLDALRQIAPVAPAVPRALHAAPASLYRTRFEVWTTYPTDALELEDLAQRATDGDVVAGPTVCESVTDSRLCPDPSFFGFDAVAPVVEPFPTASIERVGSVLLDADGDGAVWRFVRDAASFAHRDNGADGVLEFVLNLANTFEDPPDAFAATLAAARAAGLGYLVVYAE